jgi:arylformamidase
VLEAVVGALESAEFLRQSKVIADGWRERGAQTRYEEIARSNHFTVCDPLTDPDSSMVGRLTGLAERTRQIE